MTDHATQARQAGQAPQAVQAGQAGQAADPAEMTTERLLMRRWRDADREPFAAMNNDPEVMRYFPSRWDRATSDAMVERIDSFFDSHGYGLWALELRDTGEFIGYTGLAAMPAGVPGEGGHEIGWRLARTAWHQGYATEAATAARDFAFEVAGLEEIWSLTAVLNIPSIAVMRRIGMTEVARTEHPRVPEGPLRLHVFYHLAAGNRFSPAAKPSTGRA